MPLLTDRFVQVARNWPLNIALAEQDIIINYSELLAKVGKMSSLFKEKSVSANDRIVIVIENSIDYVITLLATWQVGAIAVPLNSKSTNHEIRNVVNQCNPSTMVIRTNDEVLVSDLSKLMNVVLSKSTIEGQAISMSNLSAYDVDSKWHSPEPDAIAQLLYTSGTTGSPKGVALSHNNLSVNVMDIVNYLQLTETDSIVNVLPFHYSYGNSVLLTHLYSGACVFLGGSLSFPQQLVDLLHETKSSGLSGVPTTYRTLLKTTNWKENPPPLRYMTQAGGAMGVSLTEQLISSSKRETELFVMYGQTEATARISWLPPSMLSAKLGSAGKALNHVTVSIRADDGTELRPLDKGEVYVQGDSVMRSYWENDTATMQVITQYGLKTGDLGYLDKDGFLYITGRKVDMIKVAENRINPLEIEEQINQLEFILESAAVGKPDDLLGQKLVVFVVGTKSKRNELLIKKHCKLNLASHKIPRDIYWVATLPKTASGKVQRFKLIELLRR